MKGVMFNGTRLMPGSHALELHQAGKVKELNAHMRRLDEEDRKRSGRPARSERTERLLDLIEPCCLNEKRGMSGGCLNCGDPCL